MNQPNIQRLLNQLRSGPGVVPFVGAGVSVPYGLPGWAQFLLDLARQVGKGEAVQALIDLGNYEEAADLVQSSLGRLAFDDALVDAFGDQSIVEANQVTVASLLPELARGPVVTTNFDHVLERVFVGAGQPFSRVVWGTVDDSAIQAFQMDKRVLLKIHGDVQDTQNRVLTRAEYEHHYGELLDGEDEMTPLSRILRRLLESRTVLFVGCSLNSDRTVAMLERAASRAGAFTHYAIVADPADEQEKVDRARFFSERGIRPIWYPTRRHELIEQLLLDLLVQLKESYSTAIPSALSTCDDFFEPFEDTSQIFHHGYRFIGRDAYLDKLTEFVASSFKIAVLRGRGGIGKSRLLKEAVSRIAEIEGAPQVLFYSDLGRAIPEDYRPGRLIMVIDDVHRMGEEIRKSVLSWARENSAQVQVILATWPNGISEIRSALSQARFQHEEIFELEDLQPLGHGQMKTLAVEALGDTNAEDADALLAATGDSPLITLVGARLLAEYGVQPKQLVNSEIAEHVIFDRFLDVIQGRLSGEVDSQTAKNLLTLLSAVGSFRLNLPALRSRAAEYLGINEHSLVLAIDELLNVGVLIERFQTFRISPDLLSDYILKGTVLTSQGLSTGYAEEIASQFGDLTAGQLIGNLSEVAPDLAVTVAESMIGSGKIQVRQPTITELLSLDYIDPYSGVVDTLRHFLRSPERAGRVLPLLVKLSQIDARSANGYPDHPQRVLLDVASLESTRLPWEYDALFVAIDRWCREPNAFDGKFNPLNMLERVLRKEVEETIDGVDWRKPVSAAKYTDQRRQAIRALAALTRHTSKSVQFEALTTLLDAAWSQAELDWVQAVPKEFGARKDENRLIAETAIRLLESSQSSLIACVIERSMRRGALKHGGLGLENDQAMALMAKLASQGSLLTRYLWLGTNTTDFFSDVATIAERIDVRVREVIAVASSLIDEYATAEILRSQLESEIGHIELYGQEAHPFLVLEALTQLAPGLTTEVCEQVVARHESNLAPHLDSILFQLAALDRAGFNRIAEAIIVKENTTLWRELARAMSGMPQLNDTELAIVRRLAESSDHEVLRGILVALRNLPSTKASIADEILAMIDIGSSTNLADDLGEIYLRRCKNNSIQDESWTFIARKLLPIRDVSYGAAIPDLVARFLCAHPETAVDFFVSRVTYSQSIQPSESDQYEAVSRYMFENIVLAEVCKGEQHRALKYILQLILESDIISREALVILFVRVAQTFDEEAIRLLTQAVVEEGRFGILMVSEILRAAPPFVVFENRLFVRELLERAMELDDDDFHLVRHRVLASAAAEAGNSPSHYPAYHGMTLVKLATEAAQSEPNNSALKDLFLEIADEAKSMLEYLSRPPHLLRD